MFHAGEGGPIYSNGCCDVSNTHALTWSCTVYAGYFIHTSASEMALVSPFHRREVGVQLSKED